MGIFKLFQGSIRIKKLFLGLKNIKLYLDSKLLYQLPISGASATCGTVTYNGNKQIAQDISVKLSGYTLIDDYDYIVTSNSGGTNAGSYQFTVSGINYFNSSVNGTFTINPKTVNSPTITLDPSSYTYSGSQCKPTPTVKDGSTVIPSSEYTVSYSNNINAGTATCTITDKSGGNYTVSGSETFSIAKADQAAPSVTGATTTYPTTATATASGGGQGSIEWESAQSQSSVGSHTTRARWTGNSNYNASPWSSSVTVQMNKADQSAPTATGATVDYGSTATATASGGGGQGSLEWSNGNTRTAVGSQSTQARWTGNSNYNASPWSNSVTLEVKSSHAGHDFVEIGGIKWATMNIGANSITDTGLYFQWGDTQGYTAAQVGSGEGQKYFGWADYKYGNGTSSPGATGMTKYNEGDSLITLESTDDAVKAAWGGSWRMPTTAEFQALGAAVNTAWTQVNNVYGILCTDKTDSSKVLFFPAAGYCRNGSVRNVGSGGNYWGRSLHASIRQNAYYMRFGSSLVSWNGNSNRSYGCSVRGVVG